MNPVQVNPSVNRPYTHAAASSGPSRPWESIHSSGGSEDSGSRLAATMAELRRLNPQLSSSQIGTLMLNQSGQPASYHQLSALQPTLQSGPFERRLI